MEVATTAELQLRRYHLDGTICYHEDGWVDRLGVWCFGGRIIVTEKS